MDIVDVKVMTNQPTMWEAAGIDGRLPTVQIRSRRWLRSLQVRAIHKRHFNTSERQLMTLV